MAISEFLNTVAPSDNPQNILAPVSIEKIGLSRRSHNALRRAGVHTVNQMLELDREKLLNIKNLGAKSIDEIKTLQNELRNGTHFELVGTSNIKDITFFSNELGTQCKDIPLGKLALSFRANRILTEAGYDFASKLLGITAEDLLELPNMGKGTVAEILSKIGELNFEKAEENDEENIQSEKNCMEFVTSFINHIPANVGHLFRTLLPEFESAYESGKPVDKSILFEAPILRGIIKDKIIDVLADRSFGIGAEELLSLFPETLVPENAVNMMLSELLSEGKIRKGEMIEIIRPNLWAYVDSISDNKQREILKLRLQGKTLEEIGAVCGGVTRERIRQIIKKCICNKRITIEEDKYQKIYKAYSFSKENFSLAFNTDDSVYIYLTLVCDTAGSLHIEQFLEDAYYPIEFRKGAENVVYKNYFTIGGMRVLKRRSELADYVVHTYFQDEAEFDTFVEKYNTFLQELDIADDSQFALNEATYQNRFADAENVLWKYQSRFRYYDMHGRDFNSLFDNLNLEQYTDVEYSSLKLFRSYPELMEEYDLRDEYELHNLLKKLYAKKGNDSIKFPRMPMIEFGKADRDNQVLDLLIHLAPINVQEFCMAYEDEYGVLARTVAGSFISCIDAYKDFNGTYDISAESLPPEQMQKMRELLCDDYYDISFIDQLYRREFPSSDANMINSYTLKSMGFKVLSSYVIKDNFANAAEYFRHILTKEDIVDSRNFSATLTSQLSYTSELYSLKSQYEIVEFKPLQYINRRHLEFLGISIKNMSDYCNKVSEFVRPKAFFTIHSLRRQGFTHQLDTLDFDDWFYASIITEDKERYCYRRFGGTKVFCQSTKQITMENFFEYIIKQYDGIRIYDFIELLAEEYNIKIEKYKIVEAINNSAMHYDQITEQLYQSAVTTCGLPSDDDENRINHVITSKFKSGFRISSNIDFERFENFYDVEYCEDFAYGADSLDTYLASVAVVFDDRAYVFDDEVVESILAFLEQMNSPCIHIDIFFEKYSVKLYELGIFSVDMLKAFIEKKYTDIFCRRDYISLNSEASPTDRKSTRLHSSH